MTPLAITAPNVFLIGELSIDPFAAEAASDGEWFAGIAAEEGPDGEKIIEFAGRACYQSHHRPNPATANTPAYIANIMRERHFSVMEFGEAVIYFTGVSRSFTHELIRHRHLSYAQLSQRYVILGGKEDRPRYVVPPAIRGNEHLEETLRLSWLRAVSEYDELSVGLRSTGKTVKQIREAARAVLPSCAETKIAVKGNFRAWRHFIAIRATDHAEAEMCEVAIATLRVLQDAFPASFADFEIREGKNNPHIATTPLAELV